MPMLVLVAPFAGPSVLIKESQLKFHPGINIQISCLPHMVLECVRRSTQHGPKRQTWHFVMFLKKGITYTYMISLQGSIHRQIGAGLEQKGKCSCAFISLWICMCSLFIGNKRKPIYLLKSDPKSIGENIIVDIRLGDECSFFC